MRCNVCGLELSQNARFCKNCGNAVTASAPVKNHNNYAENHHAGDYAVNNFVAQQNPGTRKNMGLIVALIIVSSLLIMTVIAGILTLVFKKTDKETEMEVTNDIIGVEIAAEKTEEQEAVEEAVPHFERTVTYSAAYKYKNMPGIYSSVEASDSEAVEMTLFIENYNRCWEEYVNYSSNEIYNYLRTGTTAYRYTANFNKTGLHEQFELIDVEDVRKTGDTYYVWVHEKIRKTKYNDESVKTYHWVYKVGKDGSGRYVELYTADPYYN